MTGHDEFGRTGDGFERLNAVATDAAERAAGRLADNPKRTALRWFAGFLVAVVVLSIIGWFTNFVGLWGSEAATVVSPANVTQQYAAVITDWQSLMTSADNACSAQTAAKSDGDPTMVEDPALAYKAVYRRIVVDYNSRMTNIFQAAKVGPAGYPRTIPAFVETTDPKGDWCVVSAKLSALRQ